MIQKVTIAGRKYRIALTHGQDGWIAECEAYPCCSATGKTMAEATQAMSTIIATWQATLEWTADYRGNLP